MSRQATAEQGTAKRAQERRVRNLERALKEERTGLVALARAFLEECPDASRMLRRVEVMARKAEANRVPDRTRNVLRYGHEVLSRAAEQIQGQPQGLFDPDVGHVRASQVEALTTPPGPQQIGFGFDEADPLSDIKIGARERQNGEAAIRDTIIACLQAGPLTDAQLRAEYHRRAGPLRMGTLREQRQELTRLGRVVKHENNGGEPTWTLLELEPSR